MLYHYTPTYSESKDISYDISDKLLLSSLMFERSPHSRKKSKLFAPRFTTRLYKKACRLRHAAPLLRRVSDKLPLQKRAQPRGAFFTL